MLYAYGRCGGGTLFFQDAKGTELRLRSSHTRMAPFSGTSAPDQTMEQRRPRAAVLLSAKTDLWFVIVVVDAVPYTTRTRYLVRVAEQTGQWPQEAPSPRSDLRAPPPPPRPSAQGQSLIVRAMRTRISGVLHQDGSRW